MKKKEEKKGVPSFRDIDQKPSAISATWRREEKGKRRGKGGNGTCAFDDRRICVGMVPG